MDNVDAIEPELRQRTGVNKRYTEDEDARQLEELGHAQELKRSFSKLTMLGKRGSSPLALTLRDGLCDS